MKSRQWLNGVLAAALMLGVYSAAANLITEDFSYGATQQDLNSSGAAGDGWDGAWGISNDRVFYVPSANLTYTADGFNNELNPATQDGVARQSGAEGMWVGVTLQRPLAQVLDGTVWLSALVRTGGTTGDDRNHAVIYAGGDLYSNFNGMGAGIRGLGEDKYVRYRTSDIYPGHNYGEAGTQNIDSQGNAILRSNVNLLLMRIEVNHNASNHDRLEVWYNPDLSNGLSGLGDASVIQDGENALGSGVNRVAIGFGRGSNGSTNTFAEIDFIRVSNASGEQGFLDVTAIPEPGSLSLLLISMTLIWYLRRPARP